MDELEEILNEKLNSAQTDLNTPAVKGEEILNRIDYICHCDNRAGVRLLMSCMLVKIHKPDVDPRQPYTEIGTDQCFSGRKYDEKYITHFIYSNKLPCNPTTAFLTPALRNIKSPLTIDIDIVGRPAQVYQDTLQLLDDVANGRVSADEVLLEVIRLLLIIRNENQARINLLIEGIERGKDSLPLSSESIVSLIEQHIACKHSSRLPVLVVVASYKVAQDRLQEKALPLHAHTAADEQTGAIGDVEVCLENDDKIITAYEMKMKRVTIDDIDRAVQKIGGKEAQIDNYVFITTDIIDEPVREYAASMYERTNGTEIVILNCIGFLRHFLHLFHRLRIPFLDAYQELILDEPDSAVRQPLKEAFLLLRKVAESDE